ncbi:hypothetical protein V6N13_082587 [Hibiscus sabdariffa]
MLWQYRPDPSHIIQVQDVELRPDLSYDEETVQILDQDERILRNRRIPMVKVQWSNRNPSEATWETEEPMREQFPHLFDPEATGPAQADISVSAGIQILAERLALLLAYP